MSEVVLGEDARKEGARRRGLSVASSALSEISEAATDARLTRMVREAGVGSVSLRSVR